MKKRMITKLPVSSTLVLIAALFCTAWVAFMRLSFHYHIDIGILGGAMWELVTIPVLLTTPLILLYTLYAMLLKKLKDFKIITACILSGIVIVSLFM